ncbi:hypothetical protein QTP86_023107, partial [Hemibagrus guttatus]
MDSAGAFLQVWCLFDPNDHGYIEERHVDEFFRHIVKKLGMTDDLIEDRLQRLRDASVEGRLQIHQVASIFLSEEENFLLLFRRDTPLDNSVEFMRIWRRYDADSSGFISAVELKSFLEDLFEQHNKSITPDKLELYTNTIEDQDPVAEGGVQAQQAQFLYQMKMFDKNQDGHLDLNDMARILSLKENFLLKFEMDSKTGALEGPEVDGFVKDMMELV